MLDYRSLIAPPYFILELPLVERTRREVNSVMTEAAQPENRERESIVVMVSSKNRNRATALALIGIWLLQHPFP